MHLRFYGQASQLEVEVVWDRAHHGISLLEERANGGRISHIETRWDQPFAHVWREEVREAIDVQVREADFFYIRIL